MLGQLLWLLLASFALNEDIVCVVADESAEQRALQLAKSICSQKITQNNNDLLSTENFEPTVTKTNQKCPEDQEIFFQNGNNDKSPRKMKLKLMDTEGLEVFKVECIKSTSPDKKSSE
ncbi:MAG: hypothetical protein MHPSP_003690, partial [Paramarteilia canceri]